jgi:hypothetical protein
MSGNTGFRFGLEAEYLLADRATLRPLWYQDLTFSRLNRLLESIPLDGFEGMEELELESPHRKNMPFIVEGYHLPNQDPAAEDLLPKGIEIRTPVYGSIGSCLDGFAELHRRMQDALATDNLLAVAIG